MRFVEYCIVVVICLFLFQSAGYGGEGPGAPEGLMCELLRAPDAAVITDAKPEFGWIVNDRSRGARQSACRVLVASKRELLKQDRGDMWDSGKLETDRSINVEYDGKPLQPESSYWWKVRTWDAAGRKSPYSRLQVFLTGSFEAGGRKWPAESRWVKLPKGEHGKYVLENRQRSTFTEVPPRDFIRIGEGHYFIDFGKAAFGTLKLNLAAEKAGGAMTLFFGERKEKGRPRVHKKPGRSNIGFKKTTLTLKKGINTYVVEFPRHISHYPNSQVLPEHIWEVVPFRYVEIQGCPEPFTKDAVRQLAFYYYFDDDASLFACSNHNLNQVWELCKYTMKATPFLALYADGNRERMPYEADAYIQQRGHYAVDREYAVARYTLHFLIFNPAWPTEWHMHAVFMAWADYMQTGNTETIERFYDDLKAKTLIALARDDGLISTRTGLVTKEFLKSVHYTGKQFRDIIDWPPGTSKKNKNVPDYHGPSVNGERDGYVFTPINTVVNAFHYRSLLLMSRMADAIGKTNDASFFRERAAKLKPRFNELLLDRKRGIYIDGVGTDHASLHANMFPLAFGLVPDEYQTPVLAHIKSKGMVCSVYGAQYLLEGLYRAGESDYALSLMTSESRRSWMNMIRVGSTMATEAWDECYKPNLTWNHAWGGAPANIIPRKLMGVEPLEPGFKKARIKPQPAGLTFATLRRPTIRGTIECVWRRTTGGGFALGVKVPANMTAELWLPGGASESLREGGRALSDCIFVKVLGKKDGFLRCEIGAGSYLFTGRSSY